MTTTATETLVHSPAVLDVLPAGIEIRDADGDTGTKIRDGAYDVIGYEGPQRADWFAYPVTVTNPSSATLEMVAGLSVPRVTLPGVLVELRNIVADVRELYDRQEAELDKLRDEDGDVPSENLPRWDELRYDIHAGQDSDMLGAVLGRLEKLIGPQGGA
ncbi:hypothetical protein [Streptomyces variabilis]